jgi:hypothetical protein
MNRLFLSLFLLSMLQGCASSAGDMLECGTVSGYLTPDPNQALYRVVVTHLDGKAVISRPNYQLPPGRYEFTVAELIDSPKLKVSLAARKPKVLALEVEVGQGYHLGAKFNTDKIYIGLDEAYWQPLVWQQTEKDCTMPQGRK